MGGNFLSLMDQLQADLPSLASALGDTVILSVIVTVNGLIGGLLVFYLTLSNSAVVRKIINGYISIFIGTPLIVFLFLLYYGLPTVGIRLSPFVIAVFGFFLNVSAYNARFLVTAYKGLLPTELEAAAAQGFSRGQIFRLITAPQVLRLAAPALASQAIQNTKDSSIVFLIQYTEFFAGMQEVAMRSFLFFETYLATALVYLLLVSAIVLAMRWLERRFAVPGLS